MNIGELTAMIGADIRDLKTSAAQAEKIMSEYARHVDRELKKSDQDWKTSATVVNTQTKKMQSDIERTSTSLQSMKKHALGLRSALSLIGSALVLKNLFDVGKEVSMLNISFEAVFGSAQKAASEMAYVKKVSDDMGQNLYVVAKQFKGLSAAAMNTVMEGQGVHDIFRAITKASASLGLSSYETEGALYAVQQMISKGTVQSEELRGQLGERLPGAFRMAAEAMGMTQKELGKALEMGQIMATDLLPKLARVLESTFTGKVSAAVAASNKLAEGWKTLRWNIAKSGFLEEAAGSVMALAQSMDSPAMQSSLAELGQGLGDMIGQLRPLIPLVSSFTSALSGVVSGIASIGTAYAALPSEITAGVGTGLIMRVLCGSTPVAMAVAMLVTLEKSMKAVNEQIKNATAEGWISQWDFSLPTLKEMTSVINRLATALENLRKAGKGDRDLNTGEITAQGKINENKDHIANARDKYAGTWSQYDAELQLQADRADKAYTDAKNKRADDMYSKYYAHIIAMGEASAGLTKKQMEDERKFYKQLDILQGTSYEKELRALKAEEQSNIGKLQNDLAAHEMFLLQKQKLDDKYKESRVLSPDMYSAEESRAAASNVISNMPDYDIKVAAHQGIDLVALRKDYAKQAELDKKADEARIKEAKVAHDAKIELESDWSDKYVTVTATTTDRALYFLKKEYDGYASLTDHKKEIAQAYEIEKQAILDAGNAEEIAKKKQFWETHDKLTMSSYQYQKQILDAEYAEYSKYITDKTALNEFYNARLQELQVNELELQKTALDGFEDGLEQVRKTAGWTFDNVKSTTVSAFSGMTDAITDFCMTGKISFSDFAESIIKDMVKMQIQAQVTAPLASGLSSIAGSIGNSLVNAYYGNVSAVGSAGPLPQAKGNVFQSPSLHEYANTVQTSPKTFAFANGGVFAEAGPEAIMPLTKGSDGKLGVYASGSSGDTYITYNVDATNAQSGVEEAIITALQDLNNNLEKRALKAVVSAANRGGNFAKAVGRT